LNTQRGMPAIRMYHGAYINKSSMLMAEHAYSIGKYYMNMNKSMKECYGA